MAVVVPMDQRAASGSSRPGSMGRVKTQAPDEGEGHILAVKLDAPAGHELQRAVVVEQLGHLAQALQHVAAAHHSALAVAADGVRGLRAAEFNRRAAARAGRPVSTLGGVGGHRAGAACTVQHGRFEAKTASGAYPSSASSYCFYSDWFRRVF